MGNIENFEISNGVLKEYKGKETTVVVPDGVTEIDAYAFFGCKLKAVVLPEGLITIGSSAFSECVKLETVVFPESLKFIGDESFFLCGKLKRVKFPSGIEAVAESAFWGCNNLIVEADEDFCYSPLDPDDLREDKIKNTCIFT